MTQQDLQNRTAQNKIDSPLVELFTLDMTALPGGSTLRFTPSCPVGESVAFQGETYLGLPIEAEGFEWNTSGAPPSPTLRLSNVSQLTQAAIITHRDLLGAKLIRIRTLRRYLDGQPESANAHYPTEIYTIDRKTKQNKFLVEWELNTSIDQQGRMIPGRQVLRDVCPLREPRWTGSAWDYSRATCPHVVASSDDQFDQNGDPVPDPEQVVYSKEFASCCVPRFPGLKPFGGFPGVARTRAS